LAAMGFAIWIASRWWTKLIAAVCVFLIFAAYPYAVVRKEQETRRAQQERYARAKALFDERCKSAGERIFNTVDDVEGVLLLNVRGSDHAAQRANPNWPDAALPDEAGGSDYIRSFLYWEQRSSSSNSTYRGYVNNVPADSSGHQTFPGYSFVDVKESDGAIYRYTLAGSRRTELEKRPIKSELASRYAVSFFNEIDPADRLKWVAGTTVTLTDMQTGEILATGTWYAFEPGMGSTDGARSPWGFAKVCPQSGSGNSPTRFFVDRILKPKQGK
jgi:hypothetical protein